MFPLVIQVYLRLWLPGTTPGQLVTTEDIPEEVDVLEPAVPKCGSNQMVYEWGGKLADPIQLFIDEHLCETAE